MTALEAKDFLVEQVKQQAALEQVPLSDLEVRMMYFTETSKMPEDPLKLNEEFEAHYDGAAYEKKISALMRNAYKRVKKVSEERRLRWDKSIRTLRRGDHYILVLWGHPLGHGSPRDWAIYLVILTPAGLLLATTHFLFPGRNGRWAYSNYIPLPNKYVMQILFLGLIAGGIFFPRFILKPVDWCLSRIDKFISPKEGPEDKA